MARPRKYPDELRERAVRLVFESKRPIAHVAQDLPSTWAAWADVEERALLQGGHLPARPRSTRMAYQR